MRNKEGIEKQIQKLEKEIDFVKANPNEYQEMAILNIQAQIDTLYWVMEERRPDTSSENMQNRIVSLNKLFQISQ